MQELIKRVESEINKTPTGELRNLLCDANIAIQSLIKNELSETQRFTADDIKDAYELGRVHEEKNSDCNGDIVKKVYLESDKLHKSINWE